MSKAQYNVIIAKAVLVIDKWCQEHKIPDDHGVEHAVIVMSNAATALQDFHLSAEEELCVLLAALFHDIEDRKFSADSSLNGTLQILKNLKAPHPEFIVELIQLVSCFKNGNTTDSSRPAWHYIPRDADRIEAIGRVGIIRASDFRSRCRYRTPFWTSKTQRFTTREELNRNITPERLDNYQRQGGYSASFIDHFYDKLLHIHRLSSGSKTLQAIADQRHEIMVDFVLEFGASGNINWDKWIRKE